MSTLKTNAAQIGQSVTATNNFTLYQPTTPDGTVRLGVGNAGSVSDILSINSSGNVSIGTTASDGKLFVMRAAASAGWLLEGQTNGISNASGLWADVSNNMEFAGRNSSGTQTIRLASSGNSYLSGGTLTVGDATTSPTTYTKLYAYSSGGQDDNNGIIQANSASTSASVIAKTPVGTTQLFQWATYGSRIGSRTKSGANAGTLYWTAGNDVVGASLTDGKMFQVGDVGPGSGGAAVTLYGGTGGDIVQFHQNRNGSTPYWYFNTSGGYGVYSDARLKENIVNISLQDSADFIRSLEHVEFNWKEEFGDPTKRISGFLAQNVLASAKTEGQKNVLTNWETFDDNDPDCPKMGLSDHRLLPSIVGTLQLALNKIDELTAKTTELEAQLAALHK